MLGNSPLERTLYIGQKGLGVSMLRQSVIANNIANVDTPRYKKHSVSFESEMNRVLDKEKEREFQLAATNERHIPSVRLKNLREVNPRVSVEWNSNYRNDENNVDIEKEISDEVKNTLHYQAVTSAVTNIFQSLKTAVV